MSASRGRRALLLALLAPPVLGAAVLGVEVELARRGPDLERAQPLALDGVVGGAGGVHLVWLGDSTAAGVGVSAAEHALPMVVAAGLGRPVRVTVLARSGARIAEVARDQGPRVAALRPDLVLVSVGANDATHLTRRGRVRDGYRRLLASIEAPAVVLGVPDMGSPPRLAQPLRALAGWRGRSVDGAIREVVRDRPGATYVDIAGPTGPAFRRDPARYFAADRYHPGDAGYRLWADTVLPVVRGVL